MAATQLRKAQRGYEQPEHDCKPGFMWLNVKRRDGSDRGFVGLVPKLDGSLRKGESLTLTFGSFRVLNIYIDEHGSPVAVVRQKGKKTFSMKHLYTAPEYAGPSGMYAE
jgi:hypothetical protein